ncbi:hypothetical protein CFC21_005877 [Triticum aestivum]|uniref:BTB domain-containing protein n=2 Tax=Triticum aestivum TaxID=4565 RepID=A0A9R1DAI6_WHEAT|nr:BTB/POZ and MATH domain-containing protein 1-like [Triticum aestivum]KAF6988315.1 hypothetical protein CFC21_005876 [Triticum aestivum]KAF6988316.1 hypothetical protein CFC21_005877 [Triticum aestivum]
MFRCLRGVRQRLSTDRHHHQQDNRCHLRQQAMNKPAENISVGSCVFQFKVDYERSKQIPVGTAFYSDIVSAGGHLWRVKFFPRGELEADQEYVSIFLEHMSKSRSVEVMFEVFMMGRDSKPCMAHRRRFVRTLEIMEDKDSSDCWGWGQFIEGTILEEDYLTEGHVTFVFSIMIIDDNCVLVPPSNIGTHLGRLLDHADGTDVSFIVDNETFHAHRAVLAARSPVFRAELFGPMSEATMPSITLHDITPATFKIMLRFIYTDELPLEDELEDSSTEMFQNLLAAADLYALDRLKIICAQKLWDKVSVDTVATILAWAETYNCQELKNRCIDFFVVEENFKKAIFTDGYALLVLKFPEIIADIKKRV